MVPRRRSGRSVALALALLASLSLSAILPAVRPGEASAATNPFAGITWVPNTPAQAQANAWRGAGRAADAAALEQAIAPHQVLEWIGGWFDDGTMQFFVNQRITQITAAGGIPILAPYNVPLRDCGQYSAGGANDPNHYRQWTDLFVRAIGNRKVIILLEPDGLTVTDCLNAQQKADRYALIGEAVRKYKSNPNAAVYIDGGDNERNTVLETRDILNAANIAQADGFFLNSTVYMYTSSEVAYGRQVSAAVGGKHFVVDTSRNGLGPQPNGGNLGFCNAPGRALGVPPTTLTGEPLADAFVWMKPIWQSDGDCGRREPDAGQDYWDYALGLARRSLQPFSDVPAFNPGGANDEWVTAVHELTLRGFIRGNGDGTFGGNATTLRAQMSALIVRPLWWEKESARNPFTDKGSVDNALWSNVGVLSGFGVARGYGDGTFNPTGPVLYQQVLLFISRGMVEKGYWQLQQDDPSYFPNLSNNTPQEVDDRRSVATYIHYTANLGGVLNHPSKQPFTDWDQPAPRAWFAVTLYRALLSTGTQIAR